MNGFILLIPFLTIRFGLLAFLDKEAVRRAAHFAPMRSGERIAYYIYQVSNVGIIVYPMMLMVRPDFSWKFYLGLACYLLGLCMCAAAIVSFSSPDPTGLTTKGIYKFSRNPMYVAYFLCFMGMAFLTQSLVLLLIVLVFQISAHWIILAEERWCIGKFGEAYRRYMKSVRRYI